MRAAVREQAIERAMRAHPAGRALRGNGGQCAGSRSAPRGREIHGPGSGVAKVPPPLRLTARGRRFVLALTVSAGVGSAALTHGIVHPAGGSSLHLAGQTSVVVRSGDTLWSIASSVAGDEDVRAVVDRIRRVNRLRGSDLVPGEVLRLP